MQQKSATQPPSPSPDAGTDQLVVVRPSGQLARGEHAFPAWGIVLIGSLTVALGLAYMYWRLRGRR